jgi:hypothetical protein
MSEQAAKLANRLIKEGEKTKYFFSNIPQEILGESLYSEGASWTVQQVLVHLVEAEDSLKHLFQFIVEGGGGVPQDFDLNRYNERAVEKLEGLSIEELASMFEARRKLMVEFVQSLSVEDLNKEGFHPFLGQAPVKEMIRLFYLHTQIHMRDIRKLLD